MIYRQLGTSELRVSAIGLGTWAIGNDFWGPVDDKDSIAAIQIALENGVTLIDTAPVYGNGHAEEIVGRALKELRHKPIVSTKVGEYRIGDSYRVDLSPESIVRQIDGSLSRLGVDTIDLYQIHRPDPATPLASTVEILLRLQEQGKFRYLGVSNFTVSQLDEIRSLTGVISLQSHYSLVHREIEEDIVPYCQNNTLGIISYGALAGGILTGKFKGIPQFHEYDRRNQFYDYFNEPLWGQIQDFLQEAMLPVARAHGKSLAEVAINWTMWQPGITSVLVGARNSRQAAQNAAAASWELTNDELDDMAYASREQFMEIHHV